MNIDERIAARVAARRDVAALLELGEDAPQHANQDYWIAFYETLRDEAEKALAGIGVVKEPARPKLTPMSDEESRRFQDSPMPFGKHAGELVWAVLEMDPQYLDWLCRDTEEDDWKQNLRRFLARKEPKPDRRQLTLIDEEPA